MSTLPCKTKPVLSSRTPIELHSDSNAGRWNSPRAIVKPMKKVSFYPAFNTPTFRRDDVNIRSHNIISSRNEALLEFE